jgi:hypothetical protein
MRRYIILILTFISFIAIAFAQEEISIAKDFVYVMSQGNYEKAVEYFDSSVSNLISSSKLKEVWESVLKNVGNYEGIIGERSEESRKYKIVYLTTKFSNAYIDIKIVFLNKKIIGLFFLPAQIKSYKTPPYVNLETFEEKDVKIGKDFVLPGKLTIPKGEGLFPVVIFVHGSGPNDMDETIGPNKIFRDLAWGGFQVLGLLL